jgi:hypothetical protein
MDYDACAETAKVLEFLARSLNAVVLERKMIQNEVGRNSEGVPVKVEGQGNVFTVTEPSLLGDGRDEFSEEQHNYQGHSHRHQEESFIEEHKQQPHRDLDKTPGIFTRCELTIQRIETHLLDPSPIARKNYVSNGKAPSASRSVAASNEGQNSETKSSQGNDGGNMSIGETLSSRNIRVAVVGNVDAGKSTMIGTLTSSCLDDGRGSSRTSIMKHRHEIESGRTSTASTHLMGFRSTGETIVGKDSVRARRKSEDEVAKESYRVITLMDLAGHEKYLKTT